MEMRTVVTGDARGFLAAMLQGVEPECDEACRIVGTPDSEDAALFVQFVPIEGFERICGEHRPRPALLGASYRCHPRVCRPLPEPRLKSSRELTFTET